MNLPEMLIQRALYGCGGESADGSFKMAAYNANSTYEGMEGAWIISREVPTADELQGAVIIADVVGGGVAPFVIGETAGLVEEDGLVTIMLADEPCAIIIPEELAIEGIWGICTEGGQPSLFNSPNFVLVW